MKKMRSAQLGLCLVSLTVTSCGYPRLPELVDGDDAGVDASGPATNAPPPGNGFCYGPSGWQVCLDARVSGQVQLQGVLDTDKSDANDPCLQNLHANWTTSQPDACIIAGGNVAVGNVRVIGIRPLVIVADSRIDVNGLLDVASHRSPSAVGAGTAAAPDCKPFAGSLLPGSGGAGGGFMFPGGNGGGWDQGSQAGGQAAMGLVGGPSQLRGGCAGQPGGGGLASDGGAGGGAVYLVSAGTISLSGTINASGAGGGGEDYQQGGGGGGSGGMIALYATSITTTATTILIADGGGGGGGGSSEQGSMTKGKDGEEPNLAIPITPALGGAGGFMPGFNGGDGGNGYPAPTTTMPGLGGVDGGESAGGGGGGGGGGQIRSNQDLGAAAVSPPAVPWP